MQCSVGTLGISIWYNNSFNIRRSSELSVSAAGRNQCAASPRLNGFQLC